MASKGPQMKDIASLYQAGIDPRTGLPLRLAETDSILKTNVKKLLRVRDEQDAINRFTWYNLPSGLDGQMLERILYYKGQAAFFYMKEDNQFYFLPYALDGTIDVYGRYRGITPLPFAGGTTSDGKEKPWIQGLHKVPQYEVCIPEDTKEFLDIMDDGAVLLSDYSKQIGQMNISRQILNDPLLDVMADCIPFCRTSLLNSTGVDGMKVETEDEASNVEAASRALDRAALNGKKWVPVVGHTEFQPLTEGQSADPEAFLMTMQSLDHFRQGLYGIENPGVFNRKGTTLKGEEQANEASTSLAMQDGLTLRQRFCDIVNSIWGIGIWCERSEMTSMADMNGDGMIGDEYDQSGTMPGEQPQGGMDE